MFISLTGGERVRTSLRDYCAARGQAELLAQWDAERNGVLTPETVSYGSHVRVWWRCTHGHTWQAAVYTRSSNGAGCPYCAGKRVWPGANDLATRAPALAAEWNYEKNGELLPENVTLGSHQEVWWLCEKGHAWRARVKSRAGGAGCPVCANRVLLPGENDFAAAHPALAAEWHPTKNGGLTPQDVAPGTRRKVWWQCERGHEWRAAVSSRTSMGAGCPVCAGKVVIAGENDLASAFPEIAAEWDAAKNGKISPQSTAAYSNSRAWWRCVEGHSYQMKVSVRTMRGCGCPYCAGRRVLAGFNDLAAREPKLAAQWHPTLNGGLTPQMVTPGSHKKVWWQCPEGHVWRAVVHARTGAKKSGCPVCTGRVQAARLSRYAAMLAEQGQTAEKSAFVDKTIHL